MCFEVRANDESPGFFLKVSKNVPRLGRRSGDFENFFLKASKSVPRIGRSNSFVRIYHIKSFNIPYLTTKM